jgi:hypothetical protein
MASTYLFNLINEMPNIMHSKYLCNKQEIFNGVDIKELSQNISMLDDAYLIYVK